MKSARRHLVASAAVVSLVLAGAVPAEAGAILPGFNANVVPRNDDLSVGPVGIGFTLNFYGDIHNAVYLNNNGNITFHLPMETYTPFPLLTTSRPVIAPFFADVDTRFHGNPVTYGIGSVGSRPAFGVNWIDVDFYHAPMPSHANSNAFQVVLVDRSDVLPGDFDIWFNYDYVEWEAGEASGSSLEGCGGTSARVGWSNGSTDAFELPGSAIRGAFLDRGTCVGAPGANALALHSVNSSVPGRYVFSVRNGVPEPAVPEPGTLVMLGGGLVFLAARLRRR